MKSDIPVLGAETELGVVVSSPTLPEQQRVKQRSVRSCQLCHQRKIRCDKKSPCSACIRGEVVCRYPGPERKPRRPHKTTITDVAARLSRLENVIKSNPSNLEDAQHAITFQNDDTRDLSHGDPDLIEHDDAGTDRHASNEDLLVQEGGSSCYVNEALLSRILDEERELQAAMGTPKVDETGGINPAKLEFEVLSDFKRPSIDDPSQHPSRHNAIKLWRAFITNVDPVCKVLHLPTMEVSVFEAISDPTHLEPDLSALLFSIYFTSATSLTAPEVFNLIGLDKWEAISGFKKGLEQSLAAANFLDTATLRSLQALTLYLYALRAFDLGRSTWSLYGLLMRSAQSIGLHRDGSAFRLSVFTAEIRRRLWWFICVAEARAAEDHGISVSSSVRDFATTRWPSNLDDCDLFPEMTSLPKRKQSWTAVSFSLVVIETTVVLPELFRSCQNSSLANSDEHSGHQILSHRMEYLENTYLRHCNRLIPAQLATWIMARFLALKTSFIGLQTLKKREETSNSGLGATEEFLINACEILELACQIPREDLLRDFQWIFATYAPYHPLTYVLWHLCVKPVGPNTGRAWNAVEGVFGLQKTRNYTVKRDLRWTIVEVLRKKAYQRMRESADTQSLIVMEEDNLIDASQSFSGHFDANTEVSFQDPALWDITATDFADWSNLVENYNMYDLDVSRPHV